MLKRINLKWYESPIARLLRLTKYLKLLNALISTI